MRSVACFRWLVAAAIAASLPATVQTVTGHSMGGFAGGGPHQSELAQRGYYQGAIDGVIGSDSREAIRAFQAAQGLPVTGAIDTKLLNAPGIKYKTG